jgi:predicted ATPase
MECFGLSLVFLFISICCNFNYDFDLNLFCFVFIFSSLDDVQWADASSCHFISYLLSHTSIRVKLLCTTRPLDQTSDSPFLNLLELEENTSRCHPIQLELLTVGDIHSFLDNGVSHGFDPLVNLYGLATLIHSKTNGNPFFVKQVVSYLVERRLIHFNEISGKWSFEIEKIRKVPYSNEVFLSFFIFFTFFLLFFFYLFYFFYFFFILFLLFFYFFFTFFLLFF